MDAPPRIARTRTIRVRPRRSGAVPLVAAAILMLAGCSGGTPPDVEPAEGLTLLHAVEPVPFTASHAIALGQHDRACLIDSYAKQVFCIDPTSGDTARFGAEGAGPGELTVPVDVVALSGGRTGVVDLALQRFTTFDSEGAALSTTHFDAMPWPVLGRADSLVALVVATLGPGNRSDRRADVVWLDPRRGVVRRQLLSLPDSAPPRPMVRGAWSPRQGFVFTSLPYTLVRFATDDAYLGQRTPRHYEPELPNERDVADRIDALKSIFHTSPAAAEIEEFRRSPKAGILPGARFTDDGLLWVATTRDNDRKSYLDVFADGARYLGSVEVRDRLLGFDVVGHTLVVLAERAEPDASGVRPLAVDWYDVGPRVTGMLAR